MLVQAFENGRLHASILHATACLSFEEDMLSSLLLAAVMKTTPYTIPDGGCGKDGVCLQVEILCNPRRGSPNTFDCPLWVLGGDADPSGTYERLGDEVVDNVKSSPSHGQHDSSLSHR
eukprot:g32951.t1